MTDYTKAVGYQQLTSVPTTTALTVPAGTRMALIQAEAQNVRWRDDGTASTATVGMRLFAGETLRYDAGQIAALQFIQETGTAILNVSYYA